MNFLKSLINFLLLILLTICINCSSNIPVVKTKIPLTEIKIEIDSSYQISEENSLTQADYSDPTLSPSTQMTFKVLDRDSVSITFYNVFGNTFSHSFNELLDPGDYVISSDFSGLNSGIYLFRVDIGNESDVRKLIILK